MTNCGGALRTAFHETLRDIPFRVREYQIRELFNRESTFEMQTHYKETATFLYMNNFSCHTRKGVNTGFAKGEALRLLSPNSSRSTFNRKTYRFSNMLKRVKNT